MRNDASTGDGEWQAEHYIVEQGDIPMNITPKYLERIQRGTPDSARWQNQCWNHLMQFAAVFEITEETRQIV